MGNLSPYQEWNTSPAWNLLLTFRFFYFVHLLERQIFHPLMHSLNACNCQGGARQKPRAGNSIRVLRVVWVTLLPCRHVSRGWIEAE